MDSKRYLNQVLRNRPRARTLLDILMNWADEAPDQTVFTFLNDGEMEAGCISYADLASRSRSIAAILQSRGTRGKTVLLLYPPGLDYITAFLGCLFAGAIAVPAYPPRRNQSLRRLEAIIADALPEFVLASETIRTRTRRMLAHENDLHSLDWLSTAELDLRLESDWRPPDIAEDSIAFLQYTSGSTAAPKGVMVTHANLLHNEKMIQSVFRQDESSVIVGWLPLYHDMGLIGTVLQPILLGASAILMTPASFLQRPVRWLQTISRYRATTSGGPNFAYDLCVRKIPSDERERLDLRSWNVAFNGSEPIRSDTINRFSRTFASCGFRKESFYPCYGLAEGTLLAAGKTQLTAPIVKTFDGNALAGHRLKAPADGPDNRVLVSCGEGCRDQRILIVDPTSHTVCGRNHVGEVWISGPSVARGYWNRPDETDRVFGARLAESGEGPFLRTGDLGFFDDRQLFVTGRIKDLIIIRGLNHYPQDIELTVECSHPALRAGCGAAFSIDSDGGEKLIIVQELGRHQQADPLDVIEAIRQAVIERHQIQPYAIELTASGRIPKTSSGKIQRHACRQMYLSGSIKGVARWQSSASVNTSAQYGLDHTLGTGDTEQWLVSYVAAQLGIAQNVIDTSKPLSAYGVDSLHAVELAHAIETSLGLQFPSAEVFPELTVAQIARRCVETTTEDRIRPTGIYTEAEQSQLSYGEQAIWFLHRMAPESPAYNIAVPIRIRGLLAVMTLHRSLQSLVNRHACLRTTFTAIRGEPSRIIREDHTVGFTVIGAELLDGDSLDELLSRQSQQPFDLEAGPLLRVDLFRRAADEHILLICLHHIIADFWSIALFIDELGKLYEAGGLLTEAALPPLAVSYTDFVTWQRQMLKGPDGEMLQSFWEQALSGELPVLNLPTQQQRPREDLFRGAASRGTIEPEVVEALKALARTHSTTLYTILLTAFEALLYRYTGQEEFLVGTPTSGRSRSRFADLVGYFVNPVILRADLSMNPDFDELLRRTRRTARSAFEHQDYPFPLLVERLRPDRRLSTSPLLQVMFNLRQTHWLGRQMPAEFALNQPGAVLTFGGLQFESLPLEQEVTQFDLTWTAAEVGGQLTSAMNYRTDLFNRSTISRMLAHLCVLLRGISENPNRRISDLPLLTESEESAIRYTWNQTTVDHHGTAFAHRRFEAIVERTPDKVAILLSDDHLSYRELNRQANGLARYLKAKGARPERVVAVCAARSLNSVVGTLAILKAGAAYLPLDPDAPPRRLGALVRDSRSALVLAHKYLTARLSDCPASLVILDEFCEMVHEQSDENLSVDVSIENLAYVIYTSGSTGLPKGVAITHKALFNLIAWHVSTYSIEPDDRATLLANPAFDASVWELWPYLSAGASIHIPDEEIRMSPKELLTWLATESITVSFMPTPLAEEFLHEVLPASLTLRALLVGGDKLIHCGRQPLPFELVNHYGPTEDAVVTTAGRIVPGATTTPPIGRPIDNKQIYVLGMQLQPGPVDISGELFISGMGLARGYMVSPDSTAEKFLPNPFGDRPGSRLYRTGDLVRWQEGGQLVFLGRVDNQIKLRGFRIEPGEIEVLLAVHPAVREAVVAMPSALSGAGRLVAYVVLEKSICISQTELRSYLEECLPEYMVPSAIVVLDRMPLTANGKVNRRALPMPEKVCADTAVAEAPRTEIERLVAAIWSEVLGIDRIGIHDDFFELGGHSLLATRIVSRVWDSIQVNLPLRTIFESPTVAAIAAIVEAAPGRRSSPVPIVRTASDIPVPLSSAQQRLWFLDQLQPNSAFYNVAGGIRLMGKLNLLALKQSIGEVVRRHQILRTAFVTPEDQPRQFVAPPSHLSIPIVDLCRLAGGALVMRALATQSARRPFNLSSGPLLRATLYRLDDAEHALVIVTHHIVVDGWSAAILMSEIGNLYSGLSSGSPSSLPELAIQYSDYAHWQQQEIASDSNRINMEFWIRQLRDAPTLLELPTDRPRPPVQTYRGASASSSLRMHLLDSLKATSAASSNTLFITLLAAFKVLLARYSDQTEILVGTPVAGRNRMELEGVIGLFVNSLVLRTEVAGSLRFVNFAARVREVALAAFEHQDFPFELLVEKIQAARSLSHSPLFQVMFAMENASVDLLDISGIRVSELEIDCGTAKFDLMLRASEARNGLSLVLEYSSDLFEAVTIDRMLLHFERILDSVARNGSQRIADIPMLSPEEEWRLLSELNPPAREGDEQCLHQFFERQAALTPQAIALEDGCGCLTYHELQERSARLADYLMGTGVKAESLVGICMERTLEMVVSILGVLRAGAAYLPLDVKYPASRIQYMLDYCDVSVILTTSAAAPSLPAHGSQRLAVDRLGSDIAGGSPSLTGRRVSPANLAYVIYTSGSTGKPKGVAIEHRSVVRFIQWVLEAFTPRDLSMALVSTSICFDLSIFEIFAPLSCGGKAIVTQDALQATDLPGYQEVTIINTVPSAMAELVRLNALPTSLETINLAGEPLTMELVERIYSVSQVKRLLNLYGPTEDTTYSTYMVIASTTDQPPTIGAAVDASQMYVLDKYLQLMPEGAQGELYIGGSGLARGYLNRPDLTAEKFLPNPYGQKVGERIYKTGDHVSWAKQGKLKYMGRKDHQVKLRGYRIELGEIETALQRHSSVRTAVASVRADQNENVIMVAYVVPSLTCTTLAAELREYLKNSLPEYMLPSAFVFLDELPFGPTGKVDRRALPAPDRQQRASVSVTVYPRTETEKAIASIWSDVLQIQPIGINDNFFDLGGQSLLATRVAARLRAHFGIDLPLRTLFESTTVADLSAAVEALSDVEPSRLLKIVPASRESYRARLGTGQVLEMPQIIKQRKELQQRRRAGHSSNEMK